MQIWRYGVLAGLSTLATQALAGPSLDQQYRAMRQAYYQFDTHSFKSLTCHVDVSDLDTSVTKFKQFLAAQPEDLQMKDDLANYTFAILPRTGISINNPTLDIALTSDKEVKNPDRLILDIRQTKEGFDEQIQGADQIISSVFNEFVDNIPDLESVTHHGKKWVVRYRTGEYETTETIEDSRIHEETDNGELKYVTDADYTAAGGSKFALQKVAILTTQGPQTLNIVMWIGYQKLGLINVPASINTNTSLTMTGVAQNTISNTITFQNCSMKK